MGPVEKGQEVKKVLFWGLENGFGKNRGSEKDRDSYTAQLFVKNGSENLAFRELSFSYRNPTLSKLKLVDFSADSEKASVLITLTSPSGFGSVQMPEPGMMDLDLRLLSGTEIVYSESQKNIPVTDTYYKPIYWPFLLEKSQKLYSPS